MSCSLNMKLNKILKKINYDIAIHGYFRNKKELVKFLKLSKYFSIGRSPNKNFEKNITIRKFNSESQKPNFNPNLIAISKDEYISEFSKSNNNNYNNLKEIYFHSCKRTSSAKKIKKQSLNEMRNKFNNLYNISSNKSDERYNEIMIRNHNVIMNNVKKFLKISSYEDENKILNFPFIKQNKNQKNNIQMKPNINLKKYII